MRLINPVKHAWSDSGASLAHSHSSDCKPRCLTVWIQRRSSTCRICELHPEFSVFELQLSEVWNVLLGVTWTVDLTNCRFARLAFLAVKRIGVPRGCADVLWRFFGGVFCAGSVTVYEFLSTDDHTGEYNWAAAEDEALTLLTRFHHDCMWKMFCNSCGFL